MNRSQIENLISFVARNDTIGAAAFVAHVRESETGKDWRKYLQWLADFLIDGVPRFTVFMPTGNSKEKFLSWSSLPGFPFCAGMGACADYCYSWKATRYPAAMCRMVQNTVLLQSETGRAHILRALDTHENRARKLMKKTGRALDCRLYVDGDFSNLAELVFWMDAIAARAWLQVYGYSKSFLQFLEYDARGYAWPRNYLVNLSAGHCHSEDTAEMFAGLSCVRGSFESVEIETVKDEPARETRGRLRAAFRKLYGSDRKPFLCPGKCDTCTPKGHACGSHRFANIPIVIAQH